MAQLLFATHNQNKVIEVNQLLDKKYELITLTDIGFNTEIEETGDTFEANALLKVKALEEIYDGNIFSEDTGLVVKYLNGEPGVRTARYAGENANAMENMDKLLLNLPQGVDRSAYFKTVMCLKLNTKIYYFEGICQGEIALNKKGIEGFGYDPIFIPEGYSESFGQLGSEVKKKLSHRAKALYKMISFLKSES